MLWKVNGTKIEVIEDTAYSEHQFQEKDLETWIEQHPEILGEPLMVIGGQVNVPGVNDKLDLLAVDPSGHTVIIEIKRGSLKDPVDIQALRYASYISRWPNHKIEQIAEGYLAQKSNGEESPSFEQSFEECTDEHETESVPSLNAKQRIIIVGQSVRTKLGSVALWLRQQGIDIRIIEIRPYKDPASNGLILAPQVIIPPPSAEEFEIGGGTDETEPWILDGEKWHLETRCGEKGRALLEAFIEALQTHFEDVREPVWNQKYYVSFKVGNAIWLALGTHTQKIRVWMSTPPQKWNQDQLAKRLGISAYSVDDALGDKLSGPTGVSVKKKKGKDSLRFDIKDDGLLQKDDFWKVLAETKSDFLKGW